MKKHSNRQRGMSLAEVLVALAIFAIIFLAALTAYDRSNRMFKTGVESSNMQQNTRVAFDKLVADVRMTGYDFDRDGIPTGSVGGTNIYQQPDEQFEYTGPSAITIRGNFDYEAENQPCTAAVTDNCDNGRELTYESMSFPVVTTGNDEIVTYALVPDSQTSIPACDPNTNCIQLYADTNIPRRSYPDPGHPACPACTPPVAFLAAGLDENVVEIPGVDLCVGGCNNPPYTLYRFTLDRSQQNFTSSAPPGAVIRTPLASNIRSMTLTYYQDAQGVDTLKDLPNTTDVSTGATIKGIGQYQVGNPTALVAERSIRAKVNSVRVTLIGMNESRDAAFTDTAETVTGGPGYFEQYRKYRLETLVSPRNIQKRGMREQDTYPPGAPTILNVCTGACAGVYIDWAAPGVNNVQGAPDQYKVIYDRAASPGFNCETTTFTNTFTHVFGTTPLCKMDPSVPYKFAVVALNSYGSATSATVTATPMNNSTPVAPGSVTATTNQNGKVTLNWTRPMSNVVGTGYTCGPPIPNAAEMLGYIVERQDPAVGTWVPLVTSPSLVTTSSPYDTVTYIDTPVTNCINYNYRVKAVESCYFDAAGTPGGGTAYNVGGIASKAISAASTPNVVGAGTSTTPPQAPSDLQIDKNSLCSGGVCDVHMYWPPVTKDTTPSPPAPPPAVPGGYPITINQYKVYRQQVGMGPYTLVATVTNPVPNSTPGSPAFGQIEFTDPAVPVGGPGQLYNYEIVAHSLCATSPIPANPPGAVAGDSVPSIYRPYPCPFPALVVGTPLILGSSFDGNGSAANPWKVATGTNAVATINVTDGSQLNRVVGRAYNVTAGSTLQWQLQCPGTVAGATCTSPAYPSAAGPAPATFGFGLAGNSTYRLDVAVVEVAPNPVTGLPGGCVEQTFAYFQDEPQNCCLIPVSANSAVVSFSSGQAFVDIILQNICSQPLTVNGLVFVINGGNVPPNEKIDHIDFPAASGGCPDANLPTVAQGFGANCAQYIMASGGLALVNSGTQTVTVPSGSIGPSSLPAGIKTVPANSPAPNQPGPYKIRVVFTRSLPNPAGPFNSFTVNYASASGNAACPVK